jgi:ABC-type glycerol-3-phosphate transport system permease component
MSHSRHQRIVKIASLIFLIGAATLVVIPFVWMISTSLKPDLKQVFVFPPQWIPRPPAFENFVIAWNSGPFWRYLMNSLIVSIVPVTLQVINACLCAYVFARIKFPGRDLLFLFFLAVLMIPAQVTVVPNYIILSRLGWLNEYQALIVPFIATAFGTFLMRQAFLTVPDDLADAAIIDGAGHLSILRHVMIPLTKPMILTFFLLNFNWRWNDYFWVLVMTSSDSMRTLPVGVIAMRAGSEGGTNWHYLMAATLLVILPVLLLFIFTQRHFIQGIARSGLKGV